jgi:hypothetical protein
MVIAAPPVPPAHSRRGYHVHDGFYLRMGLGLGGGHGSISNDGNGASNYEVGAGGLALNLWVGGTPWSGVAVGGLLSLQGINESETVVEGETTEEDMDAALALLGVFIDAFPDPQRGLHVGGSLGLAGLNAKASGDKLQDQLGVKDYDGGGLGASAWIGYMGFVGPEWSLGGMLQFTGVVTGKEEDDLKRRGTGWGLNVSFTALYH